MKKETKIKFSIIIGSILFCISFPLYHLLTFETLSEPNYWMMLHSRINRADNLIVEKFIDEKIIEKNKIIYKKDLLSNQFDNIQSLLRVDEKNNTDTLTNYLKLTWEKNPSDTFYIYMDNDHDYYLIYPNIATWKISQHTYNYFWNLNKTP